MSFNQYEDFIGKYMERPIKVPDIYLQDTKWHITEILLVNFLILCSGELAVKLLFKYLNSMTVAPQ